MPHKNPEDEKAYNRARDKRIRPQQSERMLQYRREKYKADRPEPALCDCCGRPPVGRMCLDHNRKTGHFRGWLCRNCNTGIGFLGDSIEGLQRAVYYLRVIANDDLF